MPGLLVTVPAWALSLSGRARFRRGLAPSPGRGGAGLVLGAVGSVLCVATTTIAVVGAANAPPPPECTPTPPPEPVIGGIVTGPSPDGVGVTIRPITWEWR